jgi:hypothetical protein
MACRYRRNPAVPLPFALEGVDKMSNYLTQADVENYGSDLIDVAQRAAMHTVAPHLQGLQQQNNLLQRQLAKEQRHRMDQAVEAAIPNFREIARNPRWHRWLLGIDLLTGRVRQTLLDNAIAEGSAHRAIAFFRQFLQEDGGTQQASSASSNQQRLGRQIYDRALIGRLYEARRRGQFNDVDWNRIEQDIFDAQKSGRVQDVPYITK